MPERRPWKCPECGGWIRPDVEVHFCDGPDGGVGVKRPGPPKRPPASMAVPGPAPGIVASGGGGGASSVTWTLPPGTVITTGRAYELAEPRPDMAAGEQRSLLTLNEVQRGIARLRQRLEDEPWGLGDDPAA